MASGRDDKHRALRGSECQMQLYVNSPKRRTALDAAALAALPTLTAAGATRLRWRSPLATPLFDTDRPFHEYRDGKLLAAIERPDLRRAWAAYWPPRSPRWDAVALALGEHDEPVGFVLVEAKSYPGEFRPASGGTRAAGDRLTRILQRLAETRGWLGVAESTGVAGQWSGELYQAANRYATLRFFRDFVDPPAPAWLLNLYFLNDHSHLSSVHATSREVWDRELAAAESDLGLDGVVVPHAGRAFLEAGGYDELVTATGG